MAFSDFYCNASTGDNLNAGSDAGGNAIYTSTNGNWNGSTTFTPTDGTNPVSAGVAVGQFASVYVDGASAPTAFIARITSVTNSANGAIGVSSTAQAGTRPSNSATARTIKVGGTWKGPNAASGFPITFTNGGAGTLSAATDASLNTVRVNFKNNSTYSISSGITGTVQQQVILLQGYGSTIGDGGKATIDGGGNNISLLTLASGQHIADFIVSNVGVTTGSGTGISMPTSGAAFRVVVHDVRAAGIVSGQNSLVSECEVYAFNKGNVSSGAGISLSAAAMVDSCYVHDASGSNSDGILTGAGTTGNFITRNIFDTLGGNGVTVNSSSSASVVQTFISGNDFYNNSGAAIKVIAVAGLYLLNITNNNFIKNGTYALDGGATFTRLLGFMFNNGYGSGTQANSSGDYHTTGSVVLDDSTGSNSRVVYASGVTPWNAPTTGDFRIILAAAIAAGRGAFTETDGTNTGTVGYPDIGAAQALVTAGGGEVSYGFAS